MPVPEAPRVTVTDPNAVPGAPVRPPPDDGEVRAPRRPGAAVAVLALLLAGAGGYGLARLEQSRELAAERTRADGVLSLELVDVTPARLEQSGESSLLVRFPVSVRNTGTSTVTPQDITLAGDRPVYAGPELPPGGSRLLTVTRSVPCDRLDDGLRELTGALQVRAQTPGGRRSTVLQLPGEVISDAAREARAACGRVDAIDALTVGTPVVELRGSVLVVDLPVSNGSVNAVEVLGVLRTPGLAVRIVSQDGVPVDGAVTLPAGDFTPPRLGEAPGPPVVLRAEVTADDCSRLDGSAAVISLSIRNQIGLLQSRAAATLAGPVLLRLRERAC